MDEGEEETKTEEETKDNRCHRIEQTDAGQAGRFWQAGHLSKASSPILGQGFHQNQYGIAQDLPAARRRMLPYEYAMSQFQHRPILFDQRATSGAAAQLSYKLPNNLVAQHQGSYLPHLPQQVYKANHAPSSRYEQPRRHSWSQKAEGAHETSFQHRPYPPPYHLVGSKSLSQAGGRAQVVQGGHAAQNTPNS